MKIEITYYTKSKIAEVRYNSPTSYVYDLVKNADVFADLLISFIEREATITITKLEYKN